MKLRRSYIKLDEQFTFFSECDSVFSNFYASDFVIEEKKFNSIVQYVMYRKAEQFLDRLKVKEILNSTDQYDIYRYGLSISHFQKMVWDMVLGNILRAGLKEKFMQNEFLKKKLLATQGSTIVIISTNNKLGSGLETSNPDNSKRVLWKGKNLLGELLTETRVSISVKY